jgi:enoyl-CoA hydratase/carnithine racemase
MTAQLVDLRVENGVARLVLARPGAANAFTGTMMAEFLAAVNRAAGEAQLLAISAAGEDFSVGRDRQDAKAGPAPFEAFKLITDLNTALAGFPGIVVASVQGRAFGFGVGIVMRSDIALAADDARFALDEVKLGIPPMFIMAEILEHLPPKSALDIVLSSREFGAAEAREMGLVSRVLPRERLQVAAEELVRELASRDPAVLRAAKRYLASVRELPRAARAAYALVEQTRFAERGKH